MQKTRHPLTYPVVILIPTGTGVNKAQAITKESLYNRGTPTKVCHMLVTYFPYKANLLTFTIFASYLNVAK